MPPAHVTVKAPARLHLGFLDLNFDLGRKFGSLGLAINRPSTRLRLERAAGLAVEGPESPRARAHLEALIAAHGARGGFRLVVERAIPAHIGFGSGTQLALAVAEAFRLLEGRTESARSLAAGLDRGARSGIGIGVFEAGGVVLDGGRGPGGAPPPVIARLPFPPEWRVLLIFDKAVDGLSGAAEKNAFTRLPPAPSRVADRLCRVTLMQALPALAEKDIAGWSAAVAELQRRMGDYFAPYQDGRRFASECVAKALAWLEGAGVNGVGQTSWGPTGFAFLPSSESAMEIAEAARLRWADMPNLSFLVCTGRNTGAKVQTANGTTRPAAAVS